MREVIHNVIASEAEAKEIVAAARKQAERLVSDARRAAAELLTRALAETRVEAGQLMDSSLREARQEKEARLALAAATIDREIQLDSTTHQRAVAEVVRCVCGATQPLKEFP